MCVINDQTATRRWRRRGRGNGRDSDRGVDKTAVEDSDGAYTLRRTAACGHVYTDATIVDGQTLIEPGPRPDLIDGGLTVVEGQATRFELLISHIQPNLTTIEDYV